MRNPLLPVGVGAAGVLALAYWLNRSGRQETAALLAIAVINLGVYGLLINGLRLRIVDPELQVQFLVYVMLPVLFASALLPPRRVAAVIAFNLGVILALPLFFPEMTYRSIVFGPLSFVLIASCLVLVAAWHRRRIEQERRADMAEKEEHYRTLFEGVPVGLYRTQPDGQILEVNPALVEMLGYPDQESLRALNSADICLHPEDCARWQAEIEERGLVRDFELRARRRDGQVLWLRNNARRVRDAWGQTLSYEGSLEDISVQRQMEEAIHRRSAELAMLNLAGHALNASLNLDEVLTRTLEWACKLLNATACSAWLLDSETGELVCHSARGPHRQEVEGWRLAAAQGVAGWASQTGESLIVADTRTEARHFKGIEQQTGLVLRSILAVPLQVKEEVLGVLEVLDEGVGCFTATDQALLESLITSAAIALENARLYAALQAGIRELQLAQAQLIHSSRMAAIGELAAGVAHELNNPLLSVLGYAELLLERTPADHPDRKRLEAIFRQAGRVRDIVRNLLSFSQQTVFHREPANLNRVVRMAVALIRLRLKTAGITLEAHYAPDLPDLRLDAGRMQQVVLNLLTNALDAMPEGGRLAVRTERNGQEARVRIADSGVGIPEGLRARIFEPFFSTKPVGEGTGMGLAVSLGIVQDHGGRIDVESAVGEGSAFTITLPLEPLLEAG